MKIGIDFQSLIDCSNIIWCLKDLNLQILENGKFIFSNSEDSFIFVKHYQNTPSDSIRNCDVKIKAYHTFQEWKNMSGYDFLIQSQLVENYHIPNYELKEFLNAGNISLSSASISFEHPNFYYEPLFNLNYFYYFYGFNYLNYYKLNSDKPNLIGAYHQSGGKPWRDEIFEKVKKIVGNDISSFPINNYNLKHLFEPYGPHTFGLWGLNHISSYTDYKTSVCNLLFETLQEDANSESPTQKMYGRRYITEKTLKAITFGAEEIFFIWYGPEDIYSYLREIGFWFYNSEFYKGNIRQSVYDAVEELYKLKNKLGTNNAVHTYLKENYGTNLENNLKLFSNMLDVYYKKDNVINLIKNGKRN
jgi:hypothetical protein